MKSNIQDIWREPLIHFLVLGAALFLFYELTRETGSEAPDRIVVNRGQVEQLMANFQRTWQRPPTAKELDALIENHVREEVFYREALAMGLDQNDPVVRRRLRMKLEFILEDLSAEPVTEAALTAYLQQHPDKFRTEPKISFQQVYLNADKRADISADAQRLLVDLNGGMAPASVGDVTLLPAEYRLASQSEIVRAFGEAFAEQLFEREPGPWLGPIYSPYGGHLLKVSQRVDAYLPELTEIQPLVEREYLAQRRKAQKALAYQKLREGYDITVEPLKEPQGLLDTVIATAEADDAREAKP